MTIEAYLPNEDEAIRWVAVYVDEKLVCQIGILADGTRTPIIAMPEASWARTAITEVLLRNWELEPIDRLVQLVPQGEDEMLPTVVSYRREYLVGEPEPHRRMEFDPRDRINDSLRDELIVSILDSWLDEPDQTKKRTAEITAEIATQLHANKWTIAGVRAALTKGIYGDKDHLLQARAAQRNRTHTASSLGHS